MRSLSIGATGMLAQQLNVEVISHNIANMNTAAYQRRRAEFQDLIYQNQRRVGSASSDNNTIVPVGVQVGLGVRTAAVYRISEAGNLSPTENQFDLAINGNGYFRVTLPSGEIGYTRAGLFRKNADGNLTTADGYVLQPAINVPDNAVDVTVNRSGQVLVKLDGQAELDNVGQIELSSFPNPAGLIAIGDNLHLQTAASGDPNEANPGAPGFGTIQQGFVETSNVNVVEEITQLITAQRAYEMNSKVIETSDQMLSTVANIR